MTLGNELERLLHLSSPAMGGAAPEASMGHGSPAAVNALLPLLQRRNGFYAFESALQVFALGALESKPELSEWNRSSGWRDSYGSLAESYLFFAQDLVGAQFGIRDQRIWRFDPETAEAKEVAGTLDEWAGRVLAEYRELLLWPLAHEWQQRNGPLRPGIRLVPKIPFVLGGEYRVDNLYATDCWRAMRFYGHIATQIHDLPEGATVSFEPID